MARKVPSRSKLLDRSCVAGVWNARSSLWMLWLEAYHRDAILPRTGVHIGDAVDGEGVSLEVGFLLEASTAHLANVLRLLVALVVQVTLQAAFVLVGLVALVARERLRQGVLAWRQWAPLLRLST